MLDQLGIGSQRLEIFFLSSSEGAKFAEIATEMTERARSLGPSPLRGDASQGSEEAPSTILEVNP